ncbi:uncharacterized protein BXZ73DRAFT_72775 [Epithele typhae]|uniref:uncharacterized protein n=1 Tax=Epithele typhae TaxID=378194 RepID=UPI0020079B28|nr:uncharacterized protein BXZ73DRAFT_72775 [Epithele typhae]KAH9945868.1 hypothetical protein BXZ73DRAFT_72775 [Epithele typhae]
MDTMDASDNGAPESRVQSSAAQTLTQERRTAAASPTFAEIPPEHIWRIWSAMGIGMLYMWDWPLVPPYPHRDPIEALKAYFYTRRTFPFLDRMLGVLSVLGPYGRAREDMGRLQGWQRNAQAICAVFNLLNDAKLLDNVSRFVGRIDTLLMLVRTVQGEAQNIGVLGVIDARAWAAVAAA